MLELGGTFREFWTALFDFINQFLSSLFTFLTGFLGSLDVTVS